MLLKSFFCPFVNQLCRQPMRAMHMTVESVRLRRSMIMVLLLVGRTKFPRKHAISFAIMITLYEFLLSCLSIPELLQSFWFQTTVSLESSCVCTDAEFI